MQKLFSWVLTALFAGLILTTFLYVASVIIPVLFLLILIAFLVVRYRQQKALKILFEGREKTARSNSKAEVIDVEYEIIDDNKR